MVQKLLIFVEGGAGRGGGVEIIRKCCLPAGIFLTLNTFSRPVLDWVHFSRLCCNPASPSEKHVTETRAYKKLFRSKYFLVFPFGSI